MEPEARYKLVGASLLVLIVAAVLAWIWLARHGESDYRKYLIHFETQSLLGIQMGSAVNMRGLTVGAVKGYSLSPDNPRRVDVLVGVRKDIIVRAGTTAVLARNLLTGLARIDLIVPDKAGRSLPDTAGSPFPVIPEGTSDLEEFTGSLNSLIVDLRGALKGVSDFLSQENRLAFLRAVGSVSQLAEQWTTRAKRLDVAVNAWQKMSVAIATSSREIGRAASNASTSLGKVANDFLPVVQQARETLERFSDTAKTITQVSTRVGADLDEAVLSSAGELRSTARALRSAMFSVERSADVLSDPRSVLFGRPVVDLGPGEAR